MYQNLKIQKKDFSLYQVEHTKHVLQVKNHLKNSSESPDATSRNDSIGSLEDYQNELLRRCLKMMTPSIPAVSKLPVPDLEVKSFVQIKSLILYLLNR